MSRMCAVYHIAKQLNVPHLDSWWGDCKGVSIFAHLFGAEPLPVQPSNTSTAVANMQRQGKSVVVINDVQGYYSVGDYKRTGVTVPQSYHQIHSDEALQLSSSPWWSKLQSDVEFFTLLQNRFQFRDKALAFMNEHAFGQHTVIGRHLRAGNGEGQHFIQAQRGIAIDETLFLKRIARLLQKLTQDPALQEKFQAKPPLVFLATDSGHLIPALTDLLSTVTFETGMMHQRMAMKTVVFPQTFVAKGHGVVFAPHQDEKDNCLQHWQSMFMDGVLLSHSDILVAPLYSTFTQIMPLPLVFHRNHIKKSSSGNNNWSPSFCEAATDASRMTCVDTMKTWLYRQNEQGMKTIALTVEEGGELNDPQQPQHVVHHNTIVLPDVDGFYPENIKPMSDFINSPRGFHRNYQHGAKFSTKYRHMSNAATAEWKLEI